ncbi:MAG: diaminopimelate epimerase [Prevotella sp.]|nr:diaminopimelate epimerase [Prevotella sp.]MBQ9646570.1 diaminopimelate epimerase [Prevotella sp.]
MTKTVKFTKMHGAGNDYIYVDTTRYDIGQPEEVARRWSAPHTGIGSDGLVLIGRAAGAAEADFTMRIFNADGSEAMMCGNAARCVGKYVYERGLTDQTRLRLLTPSGVKTLLLDVTDGVVERVTVDMLEPRLADERFFRRTPDLPEGTFVSMGNPHYVIFTDDIDCRPEHDGRLLERHAAFPERCNIEFATLVGKALRTRVWERGSGITCACGTGACATAVAACLSGRAGRSSDIIMDGGRLHVEWSPKDNHVYLTGPAEFVFDGEIKVDDNKYDKDN